jgi:hypothetical protein
LSCSSKPARSDRLPGGPWGRPAPPTSGRLTGRQAAHTIRARATSRGGCAGGSGGPAPSGPRFDTSTAKPHHSMSAPRAVAPRPLHLNNWRVTGNPW